MMKTFSYTYYDENLIVKKGAIKAASKKEALSILKNDNLKIISFKEKKEINFKRKIFKNYKNLYLFAYEWSALLESGLSVIETLDILSKGGKKRESEILYAIKKHINEGHSISESLIKTEEFPMFFISQIKIGEESGTLAKEIYNAANHYKNEYEQRKKMIEVFSYPLLIIVFSIIVLLIFITQIVPIFYELYKNIGIELPLSTQMIFKISFFLNDRGIYIFSLIIGIILLSSIFIKSEKGKAIKNEIYYKIKLFRNIFIKNFCAYLYTLSESGYTINDSLKNMETILINDKEKNIVQIIMNEIQNGNSLPAAMKKTEIFDETTIHLIHIGIESGRLVRFLKLSKERKESEISRTFSKLKTVLFPLILVFCGIVTAFCILCLWLPMINILNVNI